MHQAMNASHETHLSLPSSMQSALRGRLLLIKHPGLPLIPLIKNTLAYSGVIPEPLLANPRDRASEFIVKHPDSKAHTVTEC